MLRARATIGYATTGAPGLSTIYCTATPAEDGTTAQATMDRLKAAWTAFASALPTTQTVVGATTVDALDATTGALLNTYTVTGFTIVGSAGTSSYLPPATALCVNWITSSFVAGRRVRGRSFWSPLAGTLNDPNGTPTSGTITTAQAAAAAWTSASPSGLVTVVWSRPRGAVAGATHAVTGYQVNDKWAVLRSRRD